MLHSHGCTMGSQEYAHVWIVLDLISGHSLIGRMRIKKTNKASKDHHFTRIIIVRERSRRNWIFSWFRGPFVVTFTGRKKGTTSSLCFYLNPPHMSSLRTINPIHPIDPSWLWHLYTLSCICLLNCIRHYWRLFCCKSSQIACTKNVKSDLLVLSIWKFPRHPEFEDRQGHSAMITHCSTMKSCIWGVLCKEPREIVQLLRLLTDSLGMNTPKYKYPGFWKSILVATWPTVSLWLIWRVFLALWEKTRWQLAASETSAIWSSVCGITVRSIYQWGSV